MFFFNKYETKVLVHNYNGFIGQLARYLYKLSINAVIYGQTCEKMFVGGEICDLIGGKEDYSVFLHGMDGGLFLEMSDIL